MAGDTTTNDPAAIRQAVDRYIAGAPLPRRAIEGLTKAEMLAHPVPGTWSIQQIIMHLMDSDLIAGDRMKRIAAEKNPLIIGYDESAFASSLFYDELDPVLACELFEKNRLMVGEILRRLPVAAFSRTGVHNESGVKTLLGLVNGYVEHLDHHLKFLHEKRRMLGR